MLTLVGDIDPTDGIARANSFFGGLAASNPTRARGDGATVALTGVPRREVTATVPADATYLSWRLPASDTPAFDALELALAALGGQTSRLHRRLVRNDQIAEGAGASTTGLIGGTSLGFASARALPGVTGRNSKTPSSTSSNASSPTGRRRQRSTG